MQYVISLVNILFAAMSKDELIEEVLHVRPHYAPLVDIPFDPSLNGNKFTGVNTRCKGERIS